MHKDKRKALKALLAAAILFGAIYAFGALVPTRPRMAVTVALLAAVALYASARD